MLSNRALKLTVLFFIIGLTYTQEASKEQEPEPNNERILQISSAVQKIMPSMNKILTDGQRKASEAIPVAKNGLNTMMDKVKSGPGFFSIFFVKKAAQKNSEEATSDEVKPSSSSLSEPPPTFRRHQSMILFKITPNRNHLLGAGGSADIDHKFAEFKAKEKDGQHLLGGGDDDIDRTRLRLTGTGEDVNQDPFKHFLMPLPFFNFDKNGIKPFQDNDDDDNDVKPTLIIKTDDGSHAILSDDFGFHVRDDMNSDEQQFQHHSIMSPYKLKSCVMRQLLRMKASLYYRSVLHMLFISGILLFILLITMLIVRSCRRQRIIRQHAMNIAAIDSKLALGLNAPPAYEELSTEKKSSPRSSSMINSLVHGYRNQYTQIDTKNSNRQTTESDNISVSSLPNYDEHTKKMQNIHENV